MKRSALLAVLVCSLCLFHACGGSTQPPPPPPPPVPTVTISASPTTVTAGQPTTLTWASTHATSCAASATPSESDWTGSVTTSGSQNVTPAAAGTISYSLQCTGAGGNASQAASVTATAVQFAITSAAPPDGTVGIGYDRRLIRCLRGTFGCRCFFGFCFRTVFGFPLAATGGTAPYTWSWVAAAGSSLPPGLNIAGTLITGTPTTPGTYNVVVTVMDSSSPAASLSANYTITINLPAPPVVNATPPPNGAVHLPFSFTFVATGYPPLTWSETGALPPGLNFGADGSLSGTPTATGSFPITVKAQDQFGQIGSQDFTIQIFAHGFTATGSMGTERVSHTATLLSSGKVLITGGTDNNGNVLATAELYDPASGTFSATGSMASARTNHTATLLASGKVLVAGGCDAGGSNCLTSAELYDPTAGTFSATGSMATARGGHTATRLLNNKVLIAGGNTASSELYDPVAGTFSATGDMGTSRFGHTATLLASGKVLVAGGLFNGSALDTAELFDPSAGTFSATGSMTTARQSFTASLLGNGQVLVVGGLDANATPLASAELFDPNAGTFALASGSMISARYFHTATVLVGGNVLIAGGVDTSGLPSAEAELFDPSSGTFSGTGSLTAGRSQHTATRLNSGTVLLTGGNSSGGVTASAELY